MLQISKIPNTNECPKYVLVHLQYEVPQRLLQALEILKIYSLIN